VATVLAAPQLLQLRQVDGHGPDVRAAARVIERACQEGDGVQRSISTVQTIPYYLRDAACRPTEVAGAMPADVRRLWILQPTWQHGPPSGSSGLEKLHETTVEGLRVTLWQTRPRER
jgi:mannosyltransferase